jgi:hypothetical protein
MKFVAFVCCMSFVTTMRTDAGRFIFFRILIVLLAVISSSKESIGASVWVR